MFNFEATPSAQSILARVVALEAKPPDVLTVGVISEVAYELKNIGTETIDICIDGQGVSTWVSSDYESAKFPAVLYGIAFDAPCYQPVTLSPGEVRRFTERLLVPTTFPVGAASLHGTVVIKWPKLAVQEIVGTTAPVQIAKKPV